MRDPSFDDKAFPEKEPSTDSSPSSHANDPLDWPKWRKYLTFFIVCLAAFTGLTTAFDFTAGLVVQAKVYNVSSSVMSYAVSSSLAGLMLGPVIFVPFSRVVGINVTLFWSMILLIATSIWGATATGPNDYVSFTVSRGFAGLFGTIPQVLGNGIIRNVFPVEQRGRAFAFYATSFTLGALTSLTLGGFVIQHTSWTVQIWYPIGLQALSAILIFLFLEDTSTSRNNSNTKHDLRQSSWLVERIKVTLGGKQNEDHVTVIEALKLAVKPFAIILGPITILAGTFQMIAFGWFILVASLISIFLEEPYAPSKGIDGYGFTPQQTAAFSFSMWIGVILAQVWGDLLNDRVPLLISRRRGDWRPEYRLHTLWVPGLVIMPVGMGLFGASLKYHLHYMVLAVGAFFVAFAATASIPVSLNYVVESYERNPQEVGTCLNLYRLLLGLVVPFFLTAWEKRVGVGWVFGMGAFFSLFGFLCIGVLMWQGAWLRKMISGKNQAGTSVVKGTQNHNDPSSMSFNTRNISDNSNVAHAKV